MKLSSVAVFAGILGSVISAQEAPSEELATWLEAHGQTPVDYTIRKFAKHDVVLVGEHHAIRENCQFVTRLIPRLVAAGVECFATEFLRSAQDKRVQALVEAEEFDAEAARAIRHELPTFFCGYREYREILETIWRCNANRKPGQPALRVVGLDSDWTQAKIWDAGRRERMQILMRRERTMVDAIRRVVDAKKKVLVHLGYGHSITCQGIRTGTQLTKRYGPRRVFQVVLHHEMGGVSDVIERALRRRDNRPIAFDVAASPIAKLRGRKAPYMRLLPKATLEDFAQGWVFLKPAAQLERVAWLPGTVDADNFARLRRIAVRRRIVARGECETPKDLDERLRDFQRRE